MSASYDHITDEEELHKLMNATESFDERKKIRARLREIRDAQRAEMEERRKQREKESEDLVKKKFEKAEEEKRRKMEAYAHQAPTCERDSEYHSATQKLLLDKKKLADEEKAKKLEAYKHIAETERTTPSGATVKTTTTTSSSKDGSTTTVTKKTETTIKQTSGFGGVQYSRPGAGPDTAEVSSADKQEENADKNNSAEETETKRETENDSSDKNSSTNTKEQVKEATPTPAPAPSGEKSSNGETTTGSPSSSPVTDSSKGNANLQEKAKEESEKEGNQDSNAEKTVTGAVVEAGKDVAPKEATEKVKTGESSSKQEAVKKSGSSAQLNTRALRDQLASASGPGTSGSISVKSESWSSRDGVVHKTQKTEAWGAKPQGARGAMAAFKQMDANNPAPKPNEDECGLVTATMVKRAATTMRKNAVAIKQEILNFVARNTAGYENIEVTNFSSSWNNGLAFCALIHHFYPDAFNYDELNPKNRRYNFTLAFDTAEKLADIAPLLDVEDMVKMKNPDWKCVFTYVQSIYRHLRDHERNKAKPEA